MKYIHWILGSHWRYEYYCLLRFRGWKKDVSHITAYTIAIKSNYLEQYRSNQKNEEYKEFLKSDWYKKCKL